jgi:hypothetical protein
LRKLFEAVLIGVLSLAALAILAVGGLWVWVKWQYHLPSESRVRDDFKSQRADYIRFVELLQKDRSATFIESDGTVDRDDRHQRLVPAYRDFLREVGAKDVVVREDGSIEISLWGFGCTICSDSYMGVLYYPKNHRNDVIRGWIPVEVASLEDGRLPQENGSAATGLYVIPMEPDWYVFRFEYQE